MHGGPESTLCILARARCKLNIHSALGAPETHALLGFELCTMHPVLLTEKERVSYRGQVGSGNAFS